MEEKIYDFSYKREIGSTQLKTNTKLEIDNLGKVLSVTADSTITNNEVLNGELRFVGEVCYICVYIDDTNTTKSIKHIKEFEGKIENDCINSLNDPILNSYILDTRIERTNDNQLELYSIIGIDMYSFITQSCDRFENKNCITKSYPITLSSVIKSGETRINLEEDFPLKEKPLEILSVNSKLIPKNYQTGTGYIELDAYLVTQIVYTVSREEKTEMRSEILRRDIKEEIELEGIQKDNRIVLKTDIKNCSINKTIENQQIKLQIPIDIRYIVFASNEREIVVDAFNTKFETTLTYESINEITKLETYSTTERIEGEIETDSNESRVNRILSCDGNKVILSSVNVFDKMLKIEGIVYENIIYQLDDDMGTITSINAEIPFSIQVEVPYLEQDDLVSVECEIIDATNKLKKGRTIEIDNELAIYVSIVGQKYESILKEVNVSSDPVNTSSTNFLIYFAKKGNTLWDICKHLKISEDEIMLQNKDLKFPLQEDKTIVCYRKVETNYSK